MTRLAAQPVEAAPLRQQATADARAHKAGVGVRAGEQALRDQFARLVRQHTPSVIALVRRRAARGVDAEDVAQEVFCKAWQAIRSGERVQDFRAWVLTIAYRASISASRRAMVRRAFLLNHAKPATTESATPETPPLWELARAVLTSEQAAALWLTIAEGLTARQTGRVLEKDERAVRMMVSRARKKLADEAVRRNLYAISETHP